MSAEHCPGVGRSTIVDDNGDGIYLHGFGRDGGSMGQTGPYPPDQTAGIEEGRKALRRLGARYIIRVQAATAAAAAEQAMQTFQDTDTPPEPQSLSDRIGRVVAKVAIRLTKP
ncbi:hypothetical protein [Catenulispora rubra]|uniref:hypothetical protein n=1 Tax=Catenulispora rubra TaxID=280293 RepID=UPI001892883E|nr:hypothetical protein [Catenulispora rubra]